MVRKDLFLIRQIKSWHIRFVTFTGNPSWPEIVRNMEPGQQYQHRADLVCRIFIDKVAEFVKVFVFICIIGV